MKWHRALLRTEKRKEAAQVRQTETRARRLWRKTAAVTTAFTLLANPLSALAAISSADSTVTKVTQTGGRYEVESQRRFGAGNQNAVNIFNEFGLDANQIANLYFGTKVDNSANNLFNFVNARIDVNGTVNAIKNNKIGGNLYFLSKEGLFVGSTGVINTGSLYVMTPVKENKPFGYDDLKGQFTTGTPSESMDAYKRVVAANIPLNADATISVLGKINATNNIGLYAPRIAVGKNLLDGTAPVVTTAALKTGVTDFSALVNTNGASGLTGDLTATYDPNTGDIILAAKSAYANTKNDNFNALGNALGISGDVNKTITALVETHGIIDAARDAILTATATNGDRDLAMEKAKGKLPPGATLPEYVPIAAEDAENFVQTVAKVDVQGAVKSARDTVLKADANNTYIDEGKGINKLSSLLGVAGISLDASVAILDSQAAVTIGNSGSVTAGNKADIAAQSKLDATIGLDVGGLSLINVSAKIPAAGVAYSKTVNNAAVTVDGAVSADKAVNIDAKAEESVHTTATVAGKKGLASGDAPVLVAAVNVADSDNHAKVTVNHTVQAAAGDVNIAADTQNTISAMASASSADGGMASAAVNVLAHNSSAQVDINKTVTAGGSLTVNAANTIMENTAKASNEHGMGKLKADLTKDVMQAADVDKLGAAAKGLVKPLTDKLSFLKGNDSGDPAKPSPLDNLFSAGAAVVVANETNTAGVKIADTAGLKATGDLAVNAKLLVEDTHMTASATTSSFKDDAAKDVTIAAGVVYAGIDNSATVEIKDRSAKSEDAKLSGKNITVSSSTAMEYNRVDRLVRDLNRSIDRVEAAIAAIENLPEATSDNGKAVLAELADIKVKLLQCLGMYTDDFKNEVKDPGSITGDDTLDKISNTAGSSLGVLHQIGELQNELGDLAGGLSDPFVDTVSGALSVVTSALAFSEPGNYANFSAGARSAGKETKAEVAGSVTITDIDHTSRVLIGRNVELAATDKLAINSSNKIADVNITGKTMFWNASTSGPGVGVGGSFNYQDFDTHSLVAVAEGASLAGGDIKLASDSEIFHVGAMLSAGKSDGSAISGMVSLTRGDSINAVSVDDGAVVTAVKGNAANPDNKGLITIAADNKTSVTNAILSFSASGGSAGVGLGVAINDLKVQNIAAIGDNSAKKAGGIALDSLFGNDWNSANSLKGKLTAQDLTLTAATGGVINAAAVAGGMTSSGEEEKQEPGFLDKVKAPFEKLGTTVKDGALKGVAAVSHKLTDVMNTLSGSTNTAQGGTKPPAPGSGPDAPAAGVPSFSLAGAGSAAVNLVDNQTRAVADGAAIELTGGKLDVAARDSAFIGAWSGGAAISKRKPVKDSEGSTASVAFAGAVGVNLVEGETTALIKNSSIDGANAIDVLALNGGTQIAAGIAASLSKDSKGTSNSNYQGGASVSVNLIDRSINAAMDDVQVNQNVAIAPPASGTGIDVTAYARDVQVTGGVNANLALSGGQVAGGAVTVADINNKLNAGIKGGIYNYVNNVQAQSLLATTQVTAAVAVGVSAGGGSTNNAFGGVVVYNGLDNQANAAIDGATIHASGTVSAKAQDTKASSLAVQKYQNRLGDTAARDKKELNDHGVDDSTANGKAYYQGLDTNAAKDDRDPGNKAPDLNNNDKTGSTIVTAAVTVVGSDGNAGGAAVNIGDIDNKFTASIQNADIEASKVEVSADADTLLVGVAGGVAVGTKNFGGMGSVSWQTIGNNVTAAIETSKLTTDTAAVNARNSSLLVNTAGQVAVGKTAAVGATLAYNAIDNTTGAYIKGSELTARNVPQGLDLDVNAAGETNIYGIGASVTASPDNTAISGTVVINRGQSDTQAVIDQDTTGKRSKLTHVKKVTVNATDNTNLTAVVANVTGGSKVAVGAGVAVNDIGGSAGQQLAARLDHTDITTVADSGVQVAADDKAKLLTIAAGIGGSGKVAVQGAAATALVNKQLSASMTGTNIDQDTLNANNIAVTVSADNQSDIYTGAFVLAAAGKAAVGAGVSVSSIRQDTAVKIDGGKYNVKNLLLSAKADPSIYTAGFGGGVAGTAGIAGSVAVNRIENNNSAKITGSADITAQNHVALTAESDESINNYAGVLSIGGTAAIGAAVSVNDIQGNTVAAIEGSGKDKTKVTALGKAGAVTTRSKIDDSAIVNNVITGAGFDPTDNLKAKRQEENKTGIVVDASATRNIRSVLANIAGSGTAAVAGTANVNTIGGSTAATVGNASLTGGNISVSAGDYTNSTGFVGTAAGAGNVAAGLSSDTNLVDRSTEAKISGSRITAAQLAVSATGKQGISSYGAGVAVAGEGAGIAGTVGVSKLNAKTTAGLIDTEADVNQLDVTASHLGRVNLGTAAVGGAAVGAGVGLAVGVTDDASVTEAAVTDSKVKSAGNINVHAANTTDLNTLITSFGVAGLGAGVAGSVAVNNINSQVRAKVTGGELTANTGNIGIDAANTLLLDANTGGLAAGAAGVGASVSVNTLDSQVEATVENTKLTATAGNIGIDAAETRDIRQFAVNAAGGIGALSANILVTNVGKALSTAGGDDAAKAEKDAAGEIDRANSVYGGSDMLANDFGARQTGGSTVQQADLAVNAGKGKDNGSLIKAAVSGSQLTAGSDIAVKATETDKIDINSGNITVGGISANASIGILNVNRNTAVDLNQATLRAAKDIHINTLVQDKDFGVRMNMLQGTAGIYGVSAGYARLRTQGTGNISITGNSSLTANNSITVEAKEQGSAQINALGLTAGAIAAGVLVTDAANNSHVAVTVDKSSFQAKNTAVIADKANTVTANAVGGALGYMGAAVGVAATAADSGDSSVTVQNGAAFTGDSVLLLAQNAPAVKANAGSAAVGGIGAGGASVAVAKAAGAANLNVLGTNSFRNNTVNFNAVINTQNGKATAQADAAGLAAAGIAGLGFNLSQADSDMNVNMTVEQQNYQNNANLTITGRNETKQQAKTKSLTIGGVLAAGSNKAATASTGTTIVNAKGGTVGSLTVNAVGMADNTALAGSSGGGLVSAGATVAENMMNSDSTVNLSGTWTVGGSLTASAGQSDTANLNADSVQAGLAAINGAKATNTINSKNKGTAVNIADNAVLTAAAISLTAKNNLTVNNRQTYLAEGAGYGGLPVQNATAVSTINKQATVNAGKNSQLTAQIGNLTLAALTEGTLNNKVNMKTGGLVAVVTADNTNTVTVNNTVTLAQGAKAETKKFGGDVTLAANDTLDVTTAATADNEGGAAGGSKAVINNTLSRSNSVRVDGAIRSLRDVNLYAGTGADGAKGVLNLAAAAEAYNHSVIPVATPILNSQNNQANQVTVSVSGAVDSVRHINLAANQGREYVEETTSTYTWYQGGEDTNKSFTGTAAGKDSKSKHSDNYVQLDGKLTAGTQNKLTITINGTVAPPGGTIAGGQTDPTITVSTGNAAYDAELKERIKPGPIDYGNDLFARWKALGELLSEYSGKEPSGSDLQAYVGLKAEQDRVFNQMKALGLVTEETVMKNGSPATVYNVVSGFDILAVELPDLAASGGNIVIDADTMAGSGSLTAKGAPEIQITNNSSLYMKIKDVLIGDKGGEIKFNNTVITGDSNASNEAIKNLNKSQVKPNYTVKSDGPDGAPSIAINSNWNQSLNVTYTDPDDGKQETLTVKPLTTIEINGAVENMHGKVAIANKGGDILIQGENSSVQGKEIELSAVNGSVTQGYVDGIVNIGSSPEADWNAKYQQFLNNANTLDTTKAQHDAWASAVGETSGKGGSWIAGDSVYINAANINVNGLIQSGYDDYKATISQADLDNAKKASLSGPQAVVINGETLIKINDGNKSVYDQTAGKYTYVVQAYYNPRTGKIVVDDIATKGGQVHLTGRIVSTGNGKITALDGGANISVVNNAAADLQLGSIANNNVTGLIKITDLNTNTVTEYTRNQTRVTDLLGKNPQATSGTPTAYNVKSGLRYNWVKGSTNETAKTYENKVKRGLWGLVKTGDTTELAAYENNNTPVQSLPGSKRDKGSGAFIEQVTLKNVSGTDLSDRDYVMVFDNVITNESRSAVDHWTSRSGFLGWFKWDHYRWTVRTGSSQTYLNSVKADKPISIGFIGQENGKIDITGRQNVDFLGNIRNNTSAATLAVSAGKGGTAGAITQSGGTIYGDNVKLDAKSGINGIHITSLSDKVRLDAANVNSGNIDIRVDGGFANNQQFKGNVELLRAINSGSGNVSLTARGDIAQQGSALAVQGSRIDLISTNGAIGTAGQALVIRGGQNATGGDSLSASVNVAAQGDINLIQDQGNLRVGSIDSTAGDVTLTVNNGSFIDALPAGKVADQAATEKKIQKWKDIGLIAGDGAFTEKRVQQAADYKSAVEADYQTYQAQKTYYDSNPDQQTGPAYAAYLELDARFAGKASAADYLATDTKYQELTKAPAYQWTQDQLLYALQDAMINKEGGSSQTEIKAANISGRNITLTANNGGIGIDTGAVTITDFSDVNNLKQLANAEALDVTWTKNDQGQFQSATINGKSPLGIHTRENGTLNATARDNIYLTGRTTGQDTALFIDKVATTNGNIRVLGKAGVFSVNPDLNKPNFSGKDLILEGGAKNIGAIDNAIRTALSGQLTARTDGSAYIRDISGNGFTISSIYAGDNLWLRSSGAVSSFYNMADPDDPLNLGRITAQNIDIETDSDVGTAAQGLRLTNHAADEAAAATTRITGGNVYLKGITAPGKTDGTLVLTAITATAADGVVSAASTDNIALTGDIQAAKTITLSAHNGAISQSGGKVAADNLEVAAKTGIDLSRSGNTINKLTAANDTGDILVKNNGVNGLTVTVSKANAGAIAIENQTGALTVNNSLTATGPDGSITLLNHNGSIQAQGVTAGNDAVVRTEVGNIELTGAVIAGQDAQLQTDTGHITFADVTANRNADILVATEGDITGTKLQAKNGAATVETAKGAIDITTAQAKELLSLKSQAGNINVGTASSTDVSLFAKAGDLTAGTVTAGNNASLQTVTGNIKLTGSMVAGKNNLVQTQAGNIELTGAVIAGQDAQLQTDTGHITFTDMTANRNADILVATEGDITGDNAEATTGTLTVETAKGTIRLGKTTAGADISLTSRKGGITLTGAMTAGNDAKLQTATGDIAFTDITANRQVNIEALQNGGVTGDTIQSVNDTVVVRTDNGVIHLTGDVTAGMNASLTAKTGNIAFRDVLAGQNVDIQVTTEGDISGRDVKAVNDSLNILTVKGDINLRNVYAGKRAAVGADDGKITMFSIDGETVIIRVKNKDNDLHVPNIMAGKNIIITSSGIDIDQISQRPGYDGMLVFTPKPADPNAPMEYFTIGDIKTQNGLVIEELWAKRANVHVDTKRFYLDRVSITDIGHFSNDNTSVTVYGNSSPALGGADIHFWYNPELREPWMYLHFLHDDHTVESNGMLLSIRDHFDIYRQRFSGVAEMSDRMQQQMSWDNWLLWQYLREPATAYGNYERFNLLDVSQAGLPQIQSLILQPTDGNGENQLTEM